VDQPKLSAAKPMGEPMEMKFARFTRGFAFELTQRKPLEL
jgi:hypothetical protein